jgi:resuscitation-promoting factor RpfB
VSRKGIIGAVGAAVLGAVAVSGTAYATFDKAVTVSVDGKERTVHTFGSSVADALHSADISVSRRDVVAPNPSTKISDGSRIAVRYSRPLTVIVDGRKQTHWVTALNVGEAFNQLGLRFAGARMSASRSVGIGRKGLDIDVRTLKKLVIKHDGTKTAVSAPVLTVADALTSAKVGIDGNDRVRPGLASFVDDGVTIVVTRIEERTKSVTVSVPYKTIRRTDSSMYTDQSRTERSGKRGTQARVLQILYVDGKRTQVKVLSRRTLDKPIDRIVVVGTKSRPYAGGSVGGSVDDLNWAALAECESGGNPDAVNPSGYYGLYQFSLSTWESVGGSGNPTDASSAEQTYRAKLLYKRDGASQWTCGDRLYS